MPSPTTANLLNVFVLFTVSVWTYMGADIKSPTMLIPAWAAVILMVCQPGIRAGNKLVAHIAVAVTLLIFLALFMPLLGTISRGDVAGGVRVGAMMGASLVALISFIQSFIAARKAQEGD